jgi:hypothetical protein
LGPILHYGLSSINYLFQAILIRCVILVLSILIRDRLSIYFSSFDIQNDISLTLLPKRITDKPYYIITRYLICMIQVRFVLFGTFLGKKRRFIKTASFYVKLSLHCTTGVLISSLMF